MDFGCVFFGNVNVHPAVALAERRGFTHAWLYDSQMLTSDVYASLALCAVNTKKIVLGPGVSNTARRTLGMPAARLEVLRDHVRVCRDLLAGKTTPYQEGERRRMIRFLNPKSGAININKKVPIYVSASGPKTLELA